MKLYFKECKKIAVSVVYDLFLGILVFSWFQNFRGVTKTEINWEKGISPAEEACEEYHQTINQDKVTGGFARLFCDYMGLVLGLYPIFLVVMIWLKDGRDNAAEVIYSRKISSVRLVVFRYLASITMIFIPVFILSFESLIPLISFGAENAIQVDPFAYLKYILWWLLPEVMAVCAIGIFFTLLTDSPIAIAVQFLWWMVDKGVTGLSGDTKLTTLMIRHNTLRGYEIIKNQFQIICINRLLMAGIGILFVILSIWVLRFKRKGKINAADFYHRLLEHMQNKLSFGSKK